MCADCPDSTNFKLSLQLSIPSDDWSLGSCVHLPAQVCYHLPRVQKFKRLEHWAVGLIKKRQHI